MTAGVLVCIVALVLYGLQEQRTLTGYMAQVGEVPATYDAVDAFIQREFPSGMSRLQVVAKLDRLFVYAFVGGTSAESPQGFFVCFPEKGCTDEKWQQAECRCLFYQFWFAGDSLQKVLPDEISRIHLF